MPRAGPACGGQIPEAACFAAEKQDENTNSENNPLEPK